MINRIYLLALILLCFASFSTRAQDEMLKLLDSDSLKREDVTATFKNTRLINVQSVETVHRKTLDVRFTHRFGVMGTGNKGVSSYHNLWGFDEAYDVRIAFEYGITEHVTVGFSRSVYQENWELLGKWKVLSQTTDNHFPVTVTLFGNSAYSTRNDSRLDYGDPSASEKNRRRLSYTGQVIVARKFSRRISLQVLGSIVHRNYVQNPDENNLFSAGIGGRLRMTKGLSLISDYVYNFGEFRKPGNENGLYNPLGIGFEIETGGHIFSLMFTNTFCIIENSFIPDTVDTWTKGGFRFSFNISRNFKM